MWLNKYLREHSRFFSLHKTRIPFRRLILDAFRWEKMRRTNTTPLIDGSPWMTFAAIRFLRSEIKNTSCVFEWGMGGSTKFFLERARTVVSVEHDQLWFENVTKELISVYGDKWTAYFSPPVRSCDIKKSDPADPHSYCSNDAEFQGFSFERYCTLVDQVKETFDFVVVDGRARPSCIMHGVSKVRPGGILILDNAEREYYHLAVAKLRLPDWRFIDLSGPGPYNDYFWSTWAWRREVKH